jgi:hypothetical protein
MAIKSFISLAPALDGSHERHFFEKRSIEVFVPLLSRKAAAEGSGL